MSKWKLKNQSDTHVAKIKTFWVNGKKSVTIDLSVLKAVVHGIKGFQRVRHGGKLRVQRRG